MNLNWTLPQVHFEVFKYFRYYFNIAKDEEFNSLTDEESYAEVF